MTDVAIEVDSIWKKFRRGELHDSLRDLIPALARRIVGRGPQRRELAQDEFWALRDVSFHVKRGQSLGIIGPNGAGKSTMLKLLSRILRPNRGTYQVNGRLSALIEVGAGFHVDLTGRENIYLSGTILGMPRKLIRAKEQQIIDFAGVEQFIDTPVKRYSSGMSARLGFAVAAHMNPDVLLVDEVLSVGDVKFRDKCIRHMHQLIRSDVTVIFISHILDQVRALCPNTLVLDRGRAAYLGPTDGAIQKYLDLLNEPVDAGEETHASEAEIRNIRLCNSAGGEVLQCEARRPAVIEFDLALLKGYERIQVQIDISSIGGVYLGTANSAHQDRRIISQPGNYRMRFVFDPMPLADGDYLLRFKVCGYDGTQHCLWASKQPRTLSVRGGGYSGCMVRCEGSWTVQSLDSVNAAVEDVGQRLD